MPTFSQSIGVAVGLLAGTFSASAATAACGVAAPVAPVGSVVVSSCVKQPRKAMLTFAGFSVSGYDDLPVMLTRAGRVLDAHDPGRTLVNIGATAEGIRQVCSLARAKGFATIRVVSSWARDEGVPFSPGVDHVFFISDSQ